MTWLRGDLVAGITVGVMLIPQSMAYALLAGAPPIYGLYASLVPLVVYAILGTSRHLAIGIMAIDCLIVAAGLSVLAVPLTDAYLELAFLLAIMVGLIQLVMGLARFGFVVALLSRPVITGFTSAAALTIGFSQLKNLLRIPLPRTPDILTLLQETALSLNEIHLLSVLIGVTGILILMAFRKWMPLAPGPIVVVALGAFLVWQFDWTSQGIEIVGTIPTGLPVPSMPSLSLDTLRALFPTAVTLSLVQFMTVISLGKVFAARHRYTIDANRELIALGALNAIGGVFRSVPVSGSFSRSAVSEQAGGQTPMVNIIAAALIALTLLFLTPLFYFLPIPVFASIIMVAAFGMIDVTELRFLLRAKRIDGVIALTTFAATIVIGIQEGVLVGVAASVVAIMYRISRPHVAELGHLAGTRSFRNLARRSEAQRIEGIYMLRVDASFSFANADFLRDLILDHCSKHDDVRAVVVDAASMNDLDTTAAAVIAQISETLEAQGVQLYFAGLNGPALDVFRQSGLQDKLGLDRFFLSPHRAVSHLLESWGRSAEYHASVDAEEEGDYR